MRRTLALALLVPALAAGQVAHGVIRDSVSRRPIAGAVITLLDSAGGTLTRLLSNERGEYAVFSRPAIRRVRFQRLGFRMRELPPPPADSEITTDVALTPIPSLLEPVRVVANPHCPRRKDDDVVFGLLEQARAGLLTTVVAREANPGHLVMLEYQRYINRNGGVDSQHVIRDTLFASVSFHAGRTGDEFVRLGFTSSKGGGETFGLDADVLLDDGFAAGYCFHLAGRDRLRPDQVGLGFSAASSKRGRVDIDGVLWIDTIHRALRDMTFRYVWPEMRGVNPLGRTVFQEMTNGVVLIEKWAARLSAIEGGGELARARWDDGTSWRGKAGALSGHARWLSDSVARGVQLWLDGTNYVATTDSAGAFEFTDLLAGPYRLRVDYPELTAMGGDAKPFFEFTAADSEIKHDLVLPSFVDFIRDRCGGRQRFGPTPVTLLGRALSSEKEPLADAEVRFGYVGMEPFLTMKTGSDGLFQLCLSPNHAGDRVVVQVRKTGFVDVEDVRTLTEKPTLVKAVMPRKR